MLKNGGQWSDRCFFVTNKENYTKIPLMQFKVEEFYFE